MKIIKSFFILLILVNLSLLAEEKKLKVFISADMEGISGIVHSEQVSQDGRDYNMARKWMAEDVNAAVEGALEAGAHEIIANDSHGSMRNIIPTDLHHKAILISGSPKPLSMMQGIDESFSACIFIGYHSKAGTESSILDHTYSGASIYSIKINRVEMPELGINALIAGYFNVPVVFVSGDSEVCKQAKNILGDKIVVVAVKEGFGRTSAKLLPMDEARKKIKEGVKEALKNLSIFKPFKLSSPFNFEIEFLYSSQAEMAELIPGVKRIGGRKVSFSTKDFIEGFKLMRALITLAPTR
ncbi:MAG: M55 family metallopeptidase [Candidatus Aminicenantia bacterium]